MHRLSISTYIVRRFAYDWKLLLSVFVGIIVSATLVAGAPVYLRTLERQGLNTAIDRSPSGSLNFHVVGDHIPLGRDRLDRTERSLDSATETHLEGAYLGRQQYVKTPLFFVGLPHRPLSIEQGDHVSMAHFQYMSELEDHVTFVEGRMATDEVNHGPEGAFIEAVIGKEPAFLLSLGVGDFVTLTPFLRAPGHVSAKIVGILEPIDPTVEYWRGSADTFISPDPRMQAEIAVNLDDDSAVFEGGPVIDPAAPPLPLFTTLATLTDGVGRDYPGTLVSSSWLLYMDKERLKEWSISETRSRIKGMESQLVRTMPGSTVFSGMSSLVSRFETRSFFSMVPMLLLLAVMVITVIYYLSMMVSYLVESREKDVALLGSRGVSALQLLRLYAIEGIALTIAATILAPFLAMGAVAAAGMLPYFSDMTGGDLLPVQLAWKPFAVAAGAGIVCFVTFVVPGVIGTRIGLVVHKMRSSRPPSVPVFQRYHLDVAVLVIGGLVFWELYSRGHLVAGGLFEDVRVNEALLLAPVLFLVMVALVFMRLFPLLVRFVSGESAELLHPAVAATIATLASTVVVNGVKEDTGLGWLVAVVLLAAVAVAYWATVRARRSKTRAVGLAAQSVLVGLFTALEPPVASELGFPAAMGLIAIVPAQVGFLLHRFGARLWPVSLSIALLHMARNPLQYNRLILLLVLVTGLGVMATTVGGTLERSHQERISYVVPTDIRIGNIPRVLAGNTQRLRQEFLDVPGVALVTLALRAHAVLGIDHDAKPFDVLAVEAGDFGRSSWYRDDFSSRSLTSVMGSLRPTSPVSSIDIPEGSTSIGVWVNPAHIYPAVHLWIVLADKNGAMTTLSLDELDYTGWRVMKTEIPDFFESPLQLLAVQLSQAAFGPAGTPGTIALDDIHVVLGAGGEERVIDDLDDSTGWTAMTTSMISSDTLSLSRESARRGDAAVLFTFGKETYMGFHGFYRTQNAGGVPVVASSSFVETTGQQVGDRFILNVQGRLVPVVVQDTVEYFPTLDPTGTGFLLADLDEFMWHLNIPSPWAGFVPSDIFISYSPDAGDVVRRELRDRATRLPGILDREQLLASIRFDPLITGGWRAMVLLSIGIILFTATLGYVTYLMSFSRRSRGEMVSLRSLGLSRLQVMAQLGLEHLLVAMIGLGLGTWAGFQISRQMVSAVAVTETGGDVIPPFVLVTDWGAMVPVYAGLTLFFLGAIYMLARNMRLLDLQAVSMED